MEEVNLRLQHLSEQIFGCLDNESLINCQEASRSWNVFLCGKKFLQARIILEIVNRTHKVGKSWFEVFKKCNTKVIMDLRIAVEQFYKDSQIRLEIGNRSFLLSKNKQLDLDLSPLHVAAGFGQLTLFNDILQKVENKFPLDGLHRSALYFAAMNDHVHIYESMVTFNGDNLWHSRINHTGKARTIPLYIAVHRNSLKVCGFIVENNPEQIPLGNIRFGYPLLHIAAFKGHTELYKVIMEIEADKNPVFLGFTPLQIAARSGNLEMCRLILENVNDKSPVDANGQTPKEVAEELNHLEIVKLFP